MGAVRGEVRGARHFRPGVGVEAAGVCGDGAELEDVVGDRRGHFRGGSGGGGGEGCEGLVDAVL